MAQVYRFTDANGEVRLMAEIDPAPGGAQPFTVLGPFTVTHSDVDPVNNFDLGLLADGTIVWRIAVITRELFTATSERIQVQLGASAGFAQLILQDCEVTGSNGHLGLTSDVAVWEPGNHASGLPQSWVGIAQHSAHLLAADIVGGNSAGIVDIYALVSVPT